MIMITVRTMTALVSSDTAATAQMNGERESGGSSSVLGDMNELCARSLPTRALI